MDLPDLSHKNSLLSVISVIVPQKVRKCQKIAIFQIQTFELGEFIINQKKNRPEMNGRTSWLGQLDSLATSCLRGNRDDFNARCF